MRLPASQLEFFIVRLSIDLREEGGQTIWLLHGQVEHTPTGQAWRFVSLDELPRILEVCLRGLLNRRDESKEDQDVKP